MKPLSQELPNNQVNTKLGLVLATLLAVFADLTQNRLQKWVRFNTVFALAGLLGKIRLGGVFHTVGNGEPLAFGEIGGFKGHDG